MTKTKLVILAGGQGMRLREETEYRPKPMVEVAGRPLLWHIMKHFSSYGLNDFVVCLGYKGEVIKNYFLNFDYLDGDFTLTLGSREPVVLHDHNDQSGWTVTLANTGLSAETGSRIQQIQRYVKDCHYFMLTYGDGLSDVNVDELIKFHMSHGKIATVTGVQPQSRFGELVTQGDRVELFSEKPQVSQGHINGGFFVCNQEIFSYLSPDLSCNFERGPLQRLAADGELMMYEHRGFWHCVDTMRDLQQLNQMCTSGEIPWLTRTRPTTKTKS